MCGRYYLKISIEKLLEKYGILDEEINYKSTDEIFPSQKAPIILNDGNNKIALSKWGFSFSFSKKLIINARAETLEEKKTFRKPFLKQRCIIPASGFFEWKDQQGKKTKHRIYPAGKDIFSLAGLYDFSTNESAVINTVFVIITTNANKKISEIHNRMPVILDEEEQSKWLNPDTTDISKLKNILKPYPDEEIVLEPEENTKNQMKFNF